MTILEYHAAATTSCARASRVTRSLLGYGVIAGPVYVAVAVGMAAGPADGLAIVDLLVSQGNLDTYPHLWAVRGDLLAKLGRAAEARQQFERAAQLTRNASEQTLFSARARG